MTYQEYMDLKELYFEKFDRLEETIAGYEVGEVSIQDSVKASQAFERVSMKLADVNLK